MSTIASPRDGAPHPRRTPSSQNIITPTSSSRPSLDTPRGSPNPNPSAASASCSSTSTAAASTTANPQQQQKRNRAALREYYNLKKAAAAAAAAAGGGPPITPTVEITHDDEGDNYDDDHDGLHGGSDVLRDSEMDRDGFDTGAYVARALEGCGLEELLRRYARVLGEVRALDAEKKALVYDNYSKLIAATETIKKMRENMDPLNPMASTLDPAIAQIYSQASSIREELRKAVPPPDERRDQDTARRKRTRELVVQVLGTPERIRQLVKEGKGEEARRAWEMPRKLLETWKEKGLGGEDVDICLKDGEAALGADLKDSKS